MFLYHRADGSEVRELRPADEVFKADSMASLVGAPVTSLHPPGPVRADNFVKHAKGHVGDNIQQIGERVSATLYVQDGELVSAIERGDMREVSCGYTCDVVDEPGTLNGERYDRVQRGIQYNHVAIVPQGRAGSSVRLHLDAQDNVIAPPVGVQDRKDTMTQPTRIERLDGTDYIVDSDEHKAAIKFRSDIAAAKSEVAAAQAKADAAATEIKELKAKLDQANDPKRLDAVAAERVSLVESARKVLGADAKFDGKDTAQIKREVVTKAYPESKLDGKHEAYVEGLYEAAIAKADANEGADSLASVRSGALHVVKTGATQHRDSAEEYVRAIEETERAGRSMWIAKETA